MFNEYELQSLIFDKKMEIEQYSKEQTILRELGRSKWFKFFKNESKNSHHCHELECCTAC
ncbi:hypothetical protein [Rossellomorea sp. BNER]|jgi:hypothetical protein|uniref:hypothetical protein n=1 Tax=Rossellomorea sp. BNER TaxID=2962031 RepID=UPI003AF2552E|nr:hypothetical protein [Rossellomorea sp. BNER]